MIGLSTAVQVMSRVIVNEPSKQSPSPVHPANTEPAGMAPAAGWIVRTEPAGMFDSTSTWLPTRTVSV